MKLSERHIALRLIFALLALVIFSALYGIVPIILEDHFGIALGAIPIVILFGIPFFWVLNKLGLFMKPKDSDNQNANSSGVPDESGWIEPTNDPWGKNKEQVTLWGSLLYSDLSVRFWPRPA